MRPAICGLLIATTLACTDAETASQGTAAPQTPTPAAASQTQDSVVAEVAGRKITLKDVDDRWQATDPGERARVTQMLYQNQRNVLDQMIGDALIEQAAKTAGMPVEKYVEQESAKLLQPVTDADIQDFYNVNKDRAQGRTLDQLKGPITEFLASNRKAQAKAQLVDNLKQKSPLKVMLQPPRQHVELASHDPMSGPAAAPITIIEFSDYQCPFCARVNPTLTKIRAQYGDKVRIVFKDFPLPNHAQAPKAAEAAHCAGDQGKYWEMHDRLFANQSAMEVPALKQYAAALGLTAATFDQCLDSGKFASVIAEDMKLGETLGVQSTPTLYVNGRPVLGAQPFEVFQSLIDEELAGKK